jgi:hypothetical protein
MREHVVGAADTGPAVPNEPPAHYHGAADEDEDDEDYEEGEANSEENEDLEEHDTDFQTIPSMDVSADEAIDTTLPSGPSFVEAQTVLASVDAEERAARPDTETEPHEMVIPNIPPRGTEP